MIFFLFISEGDEHPQFNFPPDEFTSKKITTKILQQIEVKLFLTLTVWMY